MKHLKSYKLFESIPSEMSEDIKDILLELNDGRKAKANISYLSKIGYYVIFQLKDGENYEGFDFKDIEEYVFRIKEYLGNGYRGCSVLFCDEFERDSIDLDNLEILNSLHGKKINNFVIYI
jgi:hypothetical protein